MGLYSPLGCLTTRNCRTPLPNPLKLRFLTVASRNITTREHEYILNGIQWGSGSAYASEQLAPLRSKGCMTLLPPVKRYAADCPGLSSLAGYSWMLRGIFQQENTCSGFRFQEVKTTEHRRTIWGYKAFRSPAYRDTRRYTRSPILALCLKEEAARKRIQAIPGVKRNYSSQSGAGTPNSTVENNDTLSNTLQDGRATEMGIQENQHLIRLPISQTAVLEVSATSQQVVPSSQPVKVPAPKYWTHKLYKNGDGENIPIHYCQSLENSEKVAQLFLNETVLGFDMEWKPQASLRDPVQENVSLIQLASRDHIALFHISRFVPGKTANDLVSPTLKHILENPKIFKTGVAIKSDCTRLRKYLGIHVRGSFELSNLYKLVKHFDSNPVLINKRLVRLTDQVEEHFGLPLVKDDNVRCSDWTRALSQRQLHYAATDAYAGYQLFHTMDKKRRALDPAPPLPAHAELGLPIRVVHE
ncbi:ribonuclease H-like domain-containing protein [Aspergillus varians]